MVEPIAAEHDNPARSELEPVPFNRPAVTGQEQDYLAQVLAQREFSGGGPFTRRCGDWLAERFGAPRALTTSSGTHALEMAALLCDLDPGDEVILPSFGFSSTATAFARCGARLVFVDIDPRTMNIDPQAVTAAITAKTRVLVVLHYAGVACDMQALTAEAREHRLLIVEDAAHAIFGTYDDVPCGMLGDFGCFSFHETKNVQCGEGGALLVRDPKHVDRAEVVWEKGTDRVRFFRGEIDKYTWRDIGSSFVLSELNAAFLLAQLEHGDELTADRLRTWNGYHRALTPLAQEGLMEIPHPPQTCRHNGHIFWLKTRSAAERTELIAHLREHSVHAYFHYAPLHATSAGQRYGRFHGVDAHTTDGADRLVRLPLFYGIEDDAERVADAVTSFYRTA